MCCSMCLLQIALRARQMGVELEPDFKGGVLIPPDPANGHPDSNLVVQAVTVVNGQALCLRHSLVVLLEGGF